MKTISKTIVQDFAELHISLTYNEMYCVKGGQQQTQQPVRALPGGGGRPPAPIPTQPQQPTNPPEPPGGGGRPTLTDAIGGALIDAAREILPFAGL